MGSTQLSASQPIDVRAMAIIHRLFRQAYEEAARLVRDRPTPSPERVTFLADHIDFIVSSLHIHHEDEDALLFPKLIERAPEQAPVTEQVEHQHQVIATAVDAALAACAAWRQQPSAETGEALAAALDHLNTVVQPHLDDEEQKVVPLAAVTLTQQEWDALGKRGMNSIPRNKRAIAAGMILERLDEADRAFMMRDVPAPMRMLFPLMVARPWKKYAATLRTGT
jgi:hemerythrin-like domain-containing protein